MMSWREKLNRLLLRYRREVEPDTDNSPEESFHSDVEQLIERGKYNQALQELGEIERQSLDTHLELKLGVLKSRCLTGLAEFKTAFSIIQDVLSESEKYAEYPLTMVDALIQKADVLHELGRYAEMFEVCEKVETLLQTIHADKEDMIAIHRAALLHLKGTYFLMKHELDQAMKFLSRSLKMYKQLGRKYETSLLLYRIGSVHLYREEFGLAIDTFEMSMSMADKLENKDIVILNIHGLVIVHGLSGEMDPSRMKTYLEHGQIIQEELESERYLGFLFHTLAGHNFPSDTNLALTDTERLQDWASASGSKMMMSAALGMLGEIYRYRGELEQAIRNYQLARELRVEMGREWWLQIATINIAHVYYQRHELDQATELFQSAAQSYENMRNYGSMAYCLFFLVLICIDTQEKDQAQKYLEHLCEISRNQESIFLKQICRGANALILRTSKRATKRARAEEILKELADDDQLDWELVPIILTNLCDLLLTELINCGEDEVLDELKVYVNKLFTLASKHNSYWLLAETYWLQSKLALVEMRTEKALELLNQAQVIADQKGLQRLAMKISSEYDQLLEEQQKWESLDTEKLTLPERVEAARVGDLVTRMARTGEIETTEIADEEPIQFMLIGAHAGFSLVTKEFQPSLRVDDSLVSGFLTALTSFADEVFAQPLNRVKIGDYTMLMRIELPFLFCYVFRGQSYPAIQRLDEFIEVFKEETSLWNSLTSTITTGAVDYPAKSSV